MSVRRFFICVLIPALLLCGRAGAKDFVRTEHAESRLVAETTGLEPGKITWFAFSQKLQSGWHVYWKNPGDSGLPLDLEWDLPEGYSAGDIDYPTPERILIGPLANFGHEGAPVFLVPVTAPDSAEIGDVIEIGLAARWLICADICVPEEGKLSLRLPVVRRATKNPDVAALFAAARRALPAPWTGDARFDANANEIVLEVSSPPRPFKDLFYFPDTDGVVEPSAPQKLRRAGDHLTITMKPGYAVESGPPESLSGVLAFSGGDGVRRGYQLAPTRSEGLARAAGGLNTANPARFPALVAIAFLGGLILNLMPCVFPVVFIKAAALIETARASPPVIRRDGLVYTAGVVVTFTVLGAVLLALRAGGERLGWGFQLQSPAVVIVSAYILFLVGLNLSGVFHVGQSLQNIGSSVAFVRGAPGAFLTGVLAVFVAAPCIGPLMSAPLAAAVVLPPTLGMAIFVAMALGLAAPYLAISFAPGLGALLPRPGGWMVILRQALAFPVFGAAAFFLWVLAQQAGPAGLAKGLAGAVLLAFAAWLFERGKAEGRRALAARVFSAIAVLAAIAVIPTLKVEAQSGSTVETYGSIRSIPFDPDKLAALRAEHTPVFIDFTAAWCVTCQFNKLTVLSKPSIARAFKDNGVTVMTADWTSRDPVVSEALQSFGAAGVPLYVYYPANGKADVLALPLTEKAVLAAVNGR